MKKQCKPGCNLCRTGYGYRGLTFSFEKFCEFCPVDIDEVSKFEFYKLIDFYLRESRDSERLKNDFWDLIQGYPITITEHDVEKRGETSEAFVHALKNASGRLFYRAYVDVKEVQQHPYKYEFVSPIFRDATNFAWVVQKIRCVDNLNNNALGGLSVTLEDGGGTNLGCLFLVNYVKTGY